MDKSLTNVETNLLNVLTPSKRAFFDTYFGKVSPRRWVTNLKHYDETYTIREALVICEAFDWQN